MLVNFRFDNFLSFSDLATFSLVKGKTRKHTNHVHKASKRLNVLKFSAIYGANGSGKSNLIKAIKFSQQIIVKNVFDSDTNCYSRTSKVNKHKESSFEYEIVIDGKVYSYGFSTLLSKALLTKEWLYEIEENKETLIYSYQFEEKNLDINLQNLSNNEKDIARLNTYIEDFKNLKNYDNSLFIFFLNDAKSKFDEATSAYILNKVYDWFLSKLEVISPDGTTKTGLNYLNESNTTKVLVSFLKDFGTGITDVCLDPISIEDLKELHNPKVIDKFLDNIKGSFNALSEKENINEKDFIKFRGTFSNGEILHAFSGDTPEKVNFFTVKFKHSLDNEYYSLGEESDGTVRLLELYSVLQDKSDKIYVIDELDRSLHPNLTYTFVKKYLSNKTNSQLIVSTHEDRLLNLDILRRDEIWFIEKDDLGASQLYSLEQYKERFDKDIMNAYLEGRYGSIPKFSFFK